MLKIHQIPAHSSLRRKELEQNRLYILVLYLCTSVLRCPKLISKKPDDRDGAKSATAISKPLGLPPKP